MKKNILYIILFLTILVFWQYFGATSSNVRLLISYPTISVNYFFDNMGALWSATWITLLEALLGLIIATIFAASLMIICLYKPPIYSFILPIIVSTQVIPLIVLAPFAIILLGSGFSSKVFLAAVISFFPIFINFSTGYKSISSNVIDLLEIHNASKTFRIFRVFIPLSLPYIFAGLKISSTLAVIGAIVAEFAGAEKGLGKNLLETSTRLEPELMVNSLVLSSLIGGTLYLSIFLTERFFGKWYIQEEKYY